jgi:hypothetical protein
LSHSFSTSRSINRPLLYSQFQGALWGAVVGQAYACWPERATPRMLWPNVTWHQQLEVTQLPLLRSLPEPAAPFSERELAFPELAPEPTWSTATQLLTTLPLALYFHDQPTVLAKRLQAHLVAIQAEELLPLAINLVQHLGRLLKNQSLQHDLAEDLASSTKRLAERSSPVGEINEAITRGITCFQDTSTQVWLSLNRAKQQTKLQTNPLPQTQELAVISVATMTVGMLSGAYNGYLGMPLLAPDTISASIRERANYLCAHWCGLDRPELFNPDIAAIANPGLRGR